MKTSIKMDAGGTVIFDEVIKINHSKAISSCILKVQVWDSDTMTDDLIGEADMDLSAPGVLGTASWSDAAPCAMPVVTKHPETGQERGTVYLACRHHTWTVGTGGVKLRPSSAMKSGRSSVSGSRPASATTTAVSIPKGGRVGRPLSASRGSKMVSRGDEVGGCETNVAITPLLEPPPLAQSLSEDTRVSRPTSASSFLERLRGGGGDSKGGRDKGGVANSGQDNGGDGGNIKSRPTSATSFFRGYSTGGASVEANRSRPSSGNIKSRPTSATSFLRGYSRGDASVSRPFAKSILTTLSNPFSLRREGRRGEEEEEQAEEVEEEKEIETSDSEREGDINPMVLPVFRNMDHAGRLPLHILCMNEKVDAKLLETILEPWPNSISSVDHNGCSCMHYLCSNRAVTGILLKGMLDIMSQFAAKRKASGLKEYQSLTILTYLRRWNDRGELPLHRLCMNPAIYEDVLTALLHADPLAACCRDDRGMTPMHHLARNSACSLQMLDELFQASTLVYQAPHWSEARKRNSVAYTLPSWKPNHCHVEYTSLGMAFQGQYHALASVDMLGQSLLHHLCKNESLSTVLIEWVLQKELLPKIEDLPPAPLGSCYQIYVQNGPRGLGCHMFSRFITNTEDLAMVYDGEDPWQLLIQGCIESPAQPEDLPQTILACRDLRGQTPLHIACQAQFREKKKRGLFSAEKDTTSSIAMIKLLVSSHPVLTCAEDLDLKTPLHYICSNTSTTANLLLSILEIAEFQPAISMLDSAGRLPLHALCLNPAIAELKPRQINQMLRALVNMDKRAAERVDMFGCTPLHYLCMRGHPTSEQVRTLLRVGPRAAKMQDETGRIPADSIWLNMRMPEAEIQSLSQYLEEQASNKNIDALMNDTEEESADESQDTESQMGSFRPNTALTQTKTFPIHEEEEDDND